MKWPFTSAARPLACLALTGWGMLTEELGPAAVLQVLAASRCGNSWDTAKQSFYSLMGVVLVFLLPMSSQC